MVLMWIWWILVCLWVRPIGYVCNTYWAWWVSVGMAGVRGVTVGMAGVSGYAGMCASRALAVPPSHPLIFTALH